MREFASSVLSYTLANVLYTGQEFAKLSGVSETLVNPKNPPAPGSTGEEPTTISAYLYKKTGPPENSWVTCPLQTDRCPEAWGLDHASHGCVDSQATARNAHLTDVSTQNNQEKHGGGREKLSNFRRPEDMDR